jgi:hypothetical protein
MGPNPTYDDMSAFFASYAEHSASYDAEASSYYGGSSNGPDAFPPRLRRAPAVIVALVACDKLPTFEDLEFAGMVDSDADLIFDTLCMDMYWDPSPPASSEEELSSGEQDEDRSTSVTPSIVPTSGSPHMVGIRGIIGRNASNVSP